MDSDSLNYPKSPLHRGVAMPLCTNFTFEVSVVRTIGLHFGYLIKIKGMFIEQVILGN